MSVGALLARRRRRAGFITRRSPQSGASDIGYRRETSARIAKMVLERLGSGDPHRLALGSDPGTCRRRYWRAPREVGVGMPFAPTIDGTGAAAARDRLRARRLGRRRSGDDGHDAGTSGNCSPSPRRNLKTLDEAGPAQDDGAGWRAKTHADAVAAAYTEGTPFDRWNAIMTDHSFFVPATAADGGARAACAGLCLSLRLAVAVPERGLGCVPCAGAGLHLRHLSAQGAPHPSSAKGPRPMRWRRRMMDSWIAFAHNGSPSNDTSGAWMRYDTAKRATTIFGDGMPHVTARPNEARREGLGRGAGGTRRAHKIKAGGALSRPPPWLHTRRTRRTASDPPKSTPRFGPTGPVPANPLPSEIRPPARMSAPVPVCAHAGPVRSSSPSRAWLRGRCGGRPERRFKRG